MMWSPLPRDQTVEYEEDTGNNIIIQREYIGKKLRSDLSVFQDVPLVHSKVELERGKAVIAQAINSRKDPREVTRGDLDTEGYTQTEYNNETGSLTAARHAFTEDKAGYCRRFCRGILPVEAVRHSLLSIRSRRDEQKTVGGLLLDLSDFTAEELREAMRMAKEREEVLANSFNNNPDGLMESLVGGGGGRSNGGGVAVALPALQSVMEVCAIGASILRGGNAGLSTLVQGRNVLQRAKPEPSQMRVPGQRLEGADSPPSGPGGRIFGLNPASRPSQSGTTTAPMDASMRADYAAFEAYLGGFGLSVAQLELQAEQYHAELNASLSTVEKLNAAIRSKATAAGHTKVLVPATAKPTVRFDDSNTLHYGTVDDEAAMAAANSAARTTRTPEEISFWFSAENKSELLHEALQPEAISANHPTAISLGPAPSDPDVPTVELAALYAAYIKFATGESPVPYYSPDTSASNPSDAVGATPDADGILPAVTTYNSTLAEGGAGRGTDANAVVQRSILTERMHWRQIVEKCVLEDFHMLTPQDMDAAKNLNSFIEISKLMDHKVGDVVRGIVQHQRQHDGGSAGSSHRVGASAPLDMAPGNPASRSAQRRHN